MSISRRELLRALGALPIISRTKGPAVESLPYRQLGRTGRLVVPLALGGQASLQVNGVYPDPPDIIVRAVELGINYLDTANAYGPSQGHYGNAFRRLGLNPADPRDPNYNAALRERLYVASKTGIRFARDRSRPAARTAIDDLKTTMTTMFGDGKGAIPDGAYLDCFQLHNLGSQSDVDQLYEGLDRRDDLSLSRLGAVAGLLDYRDGANITGLNPDRKRWIRRIGITGHPSPILMQMIQRDSQNIFETLLVTLNANDRRYQPNQYNVVPVARARGMGIVCIKIFSQGEMYGRPQQPSIIQTVGVPGGVPPADLIRYPLSIPGVTAVAIGIGHINRDNADDDQLVANLAGAVAEPASAAEMLRIEQQVAQIHGTNTNYFQVRAGLQQPANVAVMRDGDRVLITWNGAMAGADPIRSYQIYAGANLIATLPFVPQTTTAPLSVSLPASLLTGDPIKVVASTAGLPFPPRRRS